MKKIARITHVHKAPTVKVDLWFVDVVYEDGTVGQKQSFNNSTFMGLILRLRMQDPALVCKLPNLEEETINFGR